jgi:hypothetical protein
LDHVTRIVNIAAGIFDDELIVVGCPEQAGSPGIVAVVSVDLLCIGDAVVIGINAEIRGLIGIDNGLAGNAAGIFLDGLEQQGL